MQLLRALLVVCLCWVCATPVVHRAIARLFRELRARLHNVIDSIVPDLLDQERRIVQDLLGAPRTGTDTSEDTVRRHWLDGFAGQVKVANGLGHGEDNIDKERGCQETCRMKLCYSAGNLIFLGSRERI